MNITKKSRYAKAMSTSKDITMIIMVIIIYIIMPCLIAVSAMWYIDPTTGIGRAVALVIAAIMAIVYEVIVLAITGIILDS